MTTASRRPTTAAPIVVADAHGVHRPDRAEPLLAGRRVDALVAEPVDGDPVWALVDGREVHRVTADGAELVATVDDGTATCLAVHHGRVWVGGQAGALWRLDGNRLVPNAAFGDAPTSADWHTPWGGPPWVIAMASHGDDLYVAVHVGGILRTPDDGATWLPTIDLAVDVHHVVVGADGTVWAATGMAALAESTDGGRTWRHHTDGLHATYALAVAVTDDGVLLGTSSGHAARDGVVYRFDGHRFTPVDGLPERLDGAVGPRDLVAAGDHAALVAPDGAVHTSDDGGRHWDRVPDVVGATAIALR